MHSGNSIICPAAGIPMIAGVTLYLAFKKAKTEFKQENIPFIVHRQGLIYSTAEFLQSKTMIFASMTPVFANISGMISAGLIMFALGRLSVWNAVKNNEW